MKKKVLQNICVYCGSCNGKNEIYMNAADRLGTNIAMAGLGLVYGGGANGLMGIVAKSAISNGGYVTGVMPTSLVDIETAFRSANDYYEVDNFHERKMLMSKLADAFIILPGGPGTLEEFIEQLAWVELGYHEKPIFVVNTNGFWDPLLGLLKQIDKIVSLNGNRKTNYIVVDEPEQAIELFLSM